MKCGLAGDVADRYFSAHGSGALHNGYVIVVDYVLHGIVERSAGTSSPSSCDLYIMSIYAE